ncbi:MAG: deoxyribonuclease IV [Nitrospirae bacterium]|nr:deoxyribonuclease IV [Nitrospirota bacterium]
MILGVHTSIAGGLHLSVERAERLGCTTIQIFSHSPRNRHVEDIPYEEAARFIELRKVSGIAPLFVHASYLINLASASDDVWEKSITLLTREMELADVIGADYLVLHPGSVASGQGEAYGRIIGALKRIGQRPGSGGQWKSTILLENMAGDKDGLLSSFSGLAGIIEQIGGIKTPGAIGGSVVGGICLDTCHAFVSGYDLSTAHGLAELTDEIGACMGPTAVRLVHLNDSKKECASKVDRHEHIGAGKIGETGLKRLVNHPAFADIPLILETPKKEPDDDSGNLARVRAFFNHPLLY